MKVVHNAALSVCVHARVCEGHVITMYILQLQTCRPGVQHLNVHMVQNLRHFEPDIDSSDLIFQKAVIITTVTKSNY